MSLNYRPPTIVSTIRRLHQHGRDGRDAVGRLVRVQQRRRAAAPIDSATNELDSTPSDVDARACSASAGTGAASSTTTSRRSSGTTRSALTDFNNGCCRPTALRSERLQQRQRPGAGPDGARAEQLHERRQRDRHVQAAGRTTVNGTLQFTYRTRTSR